MTTATDTRTGVYEAMFLVSQSAAADFNSLMEHVNHLFERASANVIAMKKWDERRLAYEIDKQKRGIYILAYFTCPGDQVSQLERDAQISEQIMRLMVTRADHLTDEEIAANDDRQGLADYAKLRAEQGEEQTTSTGAKLGAPEASQIEQTKKADEPAAPAPAPEAAPDAPKADEPKDAEPKADAPAESAQGDDDAKKADA